MSANLNSVLFELSPRSQPLRALPISRQHTDQPALWTHIIKFTAVHTSHFSRCCVHQTVLPAMKGSHSSGEDMLLHAKSTTDYSCAS